MGEAKRKLEKHKEMLWSCAGVQTMAGEVEVRWETDSAATPMGQLAYFIEVLNLTGLWSRWLAGCPLSYSNPNAPAIGDVIGMWMLSILSGHRRYSHVTTIRGDGVNPVLLAMSTVVSADSPRKGLLRIPEAVRTNWLDGNLDESKAALEEREQPYLFKLKLSKTSSAISAGSVTKPTGQRRARAGRGMRVNWRSRAGTTSGGSSSFVVRKPARRWHRTIAAS